MLQVVGLSKSFAVSKPGRGAKKAGPDQADPRLVGREFHAIRGLDFTVEAGSIVGLLGPNGAGKTTLLRVLATALQPTSGTATLDGIDIVKDPLAVRRTMGFLSGNTGLYGRLTPRELLRYFGSLHGLDDATINARIDALVERLGMAAFIDRRCDTFSSGMKQKVSIARTLIHDPSVVVFDEPTTGLDVAAAESILRLVERCRDEDKTVLLSTHHMHEVERVCDRVLVIKHGELCFSGTVDEFREHDPDGGRLDRALLALVGDDEGGAR